MTQATTEPTETRAEPFGTTPAEPFAIDFGPYGEESGSPRAAREGGRADDALGDHIGGRFRILARLGRGGVAEVFSARDTWTDRRVAVKLLPAYGSHSAVTNERVEAEMHLGKAVLHPNLCSVLHTGHTRDGRAFLVMEALTGETLGQCLRRRRHVSTDAALRITREAARGLGALHRGGIVHRDVKPDNLFLCDGAHHEVAVKVIDFGFAALSGSVPADPMRVVGTLRYTAPEQVLGEPVDARTDVYALGVVLFRALTGELPFDGCTDTEILRHHVESPVPPPSWLREGIPAEIDAVVAGAVCKHPENRYPTMEAFCDALDDALDGRTPPSSRKSVAPDGYAPATEHARRVLRAMAARS